MVFDDSRRSDQPTDASTSDTSHVFDEICDERLKIDSHIPVNANDKGHNKSQATEPKTSEQKGSAPMGQGHEIVSAKSEPSGQISASENKGDLLSELDNNKYSGVQGEDRKRLAEILKSFGNGSFKDLSKFLPGGEKQLSLQASMALNNILRNRGITAHVNTEQGEALINPVNEIVLTLSDLSKEGYSKEGLRISIGQFESAKGKESTQVEEIDTVAIKSKPISLRSITGVNLVKATHIDGDLADVHKSILTRLIGKVDQTDNLSELGRGSDKSRWTNTMNPGSKLAKSRAGLSSTLWPPPAEILGVPSPIPLEHDPKPIPASGDPAPIPNPSQNP